MDVRSTGSGNIGATNVARTLGWKKGLVTLFADVAKGFLPVLAAHLLDLGNAAAAVAGLAAFAGHLYPVFLRFKGGKGVATAAGVYLAAMPLGILVVLGVFVLVMLAGRRVSLASMSAGVLAPVVAWALSYPDEVAWMSLVIRYPGGGSPQGEHSPSGCRGRAPVRAAALVWCLTNTLTNLRVLWPSAALLFLAWCTPLGGDRRSPLQVIAPCRRPKCPRSFISVFVRHHTSETGGRVISSRGGRSAPDQLLQRPHGFPVLIVAMLRGVAHLGQSPGNQQDLTDSYTKGYPGLRLLNGQCCGFKLGHGFLPARQKLCRRPTLVNALG